MAKKEGMPISEEKIVEFVNSRIQSSKDGTARSKFIKNFGIYDRAYRGEFKQKLPDQYSQFFVRIAFQTIDTMMSFFYESLYNNYPLAKFTGRFSEDKLKADSMQHIMDYEIYHRNFIDRALSAMNWVLKYGTCVTFDYWRYGYRNRKVREYNEVVPGFSVPQTVTKPYLEYDNPALKIIDGRRFYPDPNAGSLETENGMATECHWAAHEEFSDFAKMVKSRFTRNYFNLEKLFKDQGYDSRQDDVIWGESGARGASEDEVADDYRKRVKLTHYWGPIDVKVNGTSERNFTPGEYDPTIYWIIVANDRHLVHFKKNPYYHASIPYEIGNIYKSDDSLYGMSAIETVLSEQDIMNTLINLRLDNIHNLVNPSPVVWRGGLEDKDHFRHHISGEPIYVRLAEDLGRIVNYPRQQDVGSGAYNSTMSQMEQMAMRSSAANPESMGMHPKTTRSATEVAQVSGSSAVRFKKMSFVYSTTWVQPTLRRWVQLVQQFSTNKARGMIMGQREESFVEYSPMEIQGEFDVEVYDATVSNKELVSQAYANIMASMAPYFQNGMLNPVPALRGVLDNMPLIKNADELIQKAMMLSEEEQALIQQQAPGIIETIKAMRQQKQGAATTPGSGYNGGAESMGPQTAMADTGVRVA